ncbi:MAG: EamA family transporter [Lachnospiraceae bacterium]|nr:EamA family transporter [Lachnospiraceae bacterium]
MWIMAAILSAVFAGLTSILAKCGIKKTDSDIATALRTIVVLFFAWVMAFVSGSAGEVSAIGAKSLIFLILSGVATGASWLCYFKALSIGDVNKVVPIDKSSTVLVVLAAMVLFGETDNLAVKLLGTVILSAGIYMMIEKKQSFHSGTDKRWFLYAALSAVFAALTSILAKIGITGIESNLATAVRTGVVLVMAWLIVFLKNKQSMLAGIDKKEVLFICLSGITTGASWLCFYYAIQNGIVSIVVPIDKLSIVVAVIFSGIVFKERLSVKALAGLCLMVLGTLVMAVCA